MVSHILPHSEQLYQKYDFNTLETQDEKLLKKLSAFDYIDFKGKTVIDIGASVGFFSIMAVKKGSNHVTACEIDKYCIKLIEYQVRKYKYPINVISDDIFYIKEKYDICFAFSIVHHLVKQFINKKPRIADMGFVFKKLASLTKECCVIEYCPDIIANHHWILHQAWTPKIFEHMLSSYFIKFKKVGSTVPADRILYIAYQYD